jgi:EAL domain-containing protein (putative c-di-GMP-specific phosphodiesterase class I)/GGDEF domain-containing protein
MSILRQLLLSVSVVSAVILLGTYCLSVDSARDYLADQLHVQSEDGAVSLALALSQAGNNDPATQNLLISALFDTGHFSSVRFTDLNGKVLVERQSRPDTANTPSWFRSLLPLSSKSATRSVSEGWKQLGEVTVVANDSNAWDALWRNSIKMMALIVGAGILWSLFVVALVYWLENRLLREISQHVRSIGLGGFEENVHPRVAEFAGVADALNQTRERIRAASEEQTSRIESLTIELNRDPITKVANRKYFINEFRRLLEPENAALSLPRNPDALEAGGHILVFRQRDLSAINRHMPRDFVDQWLRSVAERIEHLLETVSAFGATLARLNGSDFAILMPKVKAPKAAMIAERVRLELRSSRLPLGEGALCRWALAVADYQVGANAGEVLAQLDHALMRSESAGEDILAYPTDASVPAGTGEYAWKDAIITALAQHRLSLSTMPLRDLAGNVLRHEATLALHSDASPEPVPASLFIPPAIRLGLSAECDIQTVRLGLDWLVSNPGDLTVRVSLPSLNSDNFLPRLEKMIGDRPELCARLVIEIDAHGLIEQQSAVLELCRIAQQADVRVGLRRLAQQFGAMANLHLFPLAYIKLSGRFISGMEQSLGSQQLGASVVETARALSIDVYAEDVPNHETEIILRSLGIAIMCGPGVGEADDRH